MDSPTFLTPAEMYQKAKAAGQTTWEGAVPIITPPCDCLECAEQYRSVDEQSTKFHCLYAGTIKGSEAISQCQRFCTSLIDDLQLVRSVLISHEELIQKRWLKKSNTKRKAFLKQVRPTMYESENAFMEIQTKCPDAFSTRQYRGTFLLPYLTVDALSKDGSRLLRLMHHRMCNAPEAWVTFDNRQILAGWLAGSFEEKFNSGCITLYGSSYGDFHNGDSYGVPRGLLILEAQATLMRFLRDFVTSMLASIENLTVEEAFHKLALASTRPLEPPQLLQPSWMQLGLLYYNEPFSAPPVFDEDTISQLIDLVKEKREETQDHLWLLQTDPSYFYEFSSYWKEHNTGTVSGSRMTKVAKRRFLEGRIMCYSVTQAQDWDNLAEELQYVQQEYQAHKGSIKPGRNLPESYDRALGCLVLLVINCLINKATHVKELTFVSPAWKSMWQVEPELSGKETCMRRKDGRMINFKEIFKTDHILYCLTALGERPESAGSHDIAVVLKSLDLHLANCSKAEAAKIDTITYSRLTDMASMYRILAALRMHRPSISLQYTSETVVNHAHDSQTWRRWHSGKEMLKMAEDPLHFGFGLAFDNLEKFRMPTGKKDQQWIERADEAHRALSALWSQARKNYEKMYRKLNMNARDTEDVLRMLSYHDAPEYQVTVASEREEILEKIAQTQLAKKPAANMPSIYETSIPHVLAAKDQPKKAALALAEAKSKVKTRSTDAGSSHQAEEQEQPATPDPSPAELRIPLPKKPKSVDALRLLFPTATSDLKGTIQWTDLIAALQELGFSGEHRGGSEWTFRSEGGGSGGGDKEGTQGDDKGEGGSGRKSIVIHQPHPEQKMGAVKLQQIGKRLWRRFGWSRERFEGL